MVTSKTRLEARFDSPDQFLKAYDSEISKSGLLIRSHSVEIAQLMVECVLAVFVENEQVAELNARVVSSIEHVGITVLFDEVPYELTMLAQKLRRDASKGQTSHQVCASQRIREMTSAQKMHLAVSGDREERLALFRDINKTLHIYVLKNPRIKIEEVAWAAKQPTLSPDALKMISENRDWNGNIGVLMALVRNPKTPLNIALKVLDRLPLGEIRALAKSNNVREAIVGAARKKVNNSV